MKVWTENDMEDIAKVITISGHELEDLTIWTENDMEKVSQEITKSAHEMEDLTIYGYRVGDLVPLAWALRKKGVQAEEIEDWSRVLRLMLETVQVTVIDDLKDKIRSAMQDSMTVLKEEDDGR